MITRDVFKIKHNNLRMQKIIDQSNLEVSIGLTLVSMFLYISLFSREVKLLLTSSNTLLFADKVFILSFIMFLIADVCLLIAALNFALTSKTDTKQLHIFMHFFIVATTVFCINVFCYHTAKVYDVNVFLGTMVSIYCVLYIQPIASLSMLTLSFLAFYFVRLSPSLAINNSNWMECLLVYLLLINISVWKYGRKVGIAERLDVLERTSRRDGLTGLKNRSAFRQDFNGYLGKNLNIMMVDINDFKGVNDTFGHSVGDDLVSAYGALFIEKFGDEWSYRYGGDEFMVIIPDMSQDDFGAVVEVWSSCLKELKIPNTDITVGCSYGYASGKISTPDDMRAMIRLADARLYENKHTVSKDELTSLLSYQGFMDQAPEYLKASFEAGGKCSLAFCKIDNFDDFNSCFGYAEGDRLVLSVAEKLQRLFPDALIARVGVAKFAVLTETEEVNQKSLELHNFVSNFKNNSSLFLKIGVYNFTDSTISLADALSWSKMALSYLSNRHNKYICEFDMSMLDKYEVNNYILKNIRTALDDNLIDVYYQPIYNMQTHKCVACEATAVWNTKEFGVIDKDLLVDVLEASYLIDKFDLYVLDHVLSDIKYLVEDGINISVCINLSRLACNSDGFIDKVIAKVSKENIDPSMLCFGITNTDVAYGADEFLSSISTLKQKGLSVWMGDSAQRYSNLLNALGVGFDFIKLDLGCMDRSYVANTDEILNTVLNGCEKLGVKLIVEGVDDSETLNMINEVNAIFIQGKHCCGPLDITKIHSMFKDL